MATPQPLAGNIILTCALLGFPVSFVPCALCLFHVQAWLSPDHPCLPTNHSSLPCAAASSPSPRASRECKLGDPRVHDLESAAAWFILTIRGCWLLDPVPWGILHSSSLSRTVAANLCGCVPEPSILSQLLDPQLPRGVPSPLDRKELDKRKVCCFINTQKTNDDITYYSYSA